MLRNKLASAGLGLALVLITTGSIAHAQSDHGQSGDSQGHNGRPNPAATPELDPSLLYSVGLAGLATAALLERRNRRGQDRDNLK
jgi:hypothetical protein